MGEADLHFAIMGPCTECKSKHDMTQLSFDNTRSYYTSITLQDQPLWALLDTGATISTVYSSLCRRFGWEITPKQAMIHLASARHTVERIGITNKLRVLCNGKTIHHSFEDLDLHAHTDICIGNDIKNQFGIHLVGLPSCWHRSGLPQPPTPIIDEHEPNHSPAGSPEQHKQFLDAIQPYLQANAQIPVSSFCTVPESVIYLDTPEGKTSYCRQYDLPPSLVLLLKQQVDKWLSDGIIVRAPVNTRWNGPLTFAPKKRCSRKLYRLSSMLGSAVHQSAFA